MSAPASAQASDRLRVLIVDDHPLFRKGLRALLASVEQVDIIGEAENGAGAEALVAASAPDLVLMDLQMPGTGGLDAIRRITTGHAGVRVLVVTMFEDDDSVFAALKAGALGYVLKDMDDAEMTRAILAVGHGEAIFSPSIASRILSFFATSPVRPTQAFPELTDSERNVLRLVSRGWKNDAIATDLSLSPKTVRNYISSIFTKLQVADRAQAVVKARDAHLE
jgi:DNA-binding NarL/FixJ family response regulator